MAWRIRELWVANTYPQGWNEGGEEVRGDQMLDRVTVIGANELVVQPLLLGK